MPVVFQEQITRAEVKAHPDRVYAFDDSLAGKGYAGFAAQCHGERNAIGILTCKGPAACASARLTDADFDWWIKDTGRAWDRLAVAIHDRKTVVFPKAGLGAGAAELSLSAPRIHRAIEALVFGLGQLEQRYQRVEAAERGFAAGRGARR